MNRIQKAKVGIIIPAFNVEGYLDAAIKSCVNQTYDNIEIIIIDDGSRDNTLEIARSYAAEDSRIIVYHQENSGVSVARNKGIELCSAEYVIFLDSDDWLEKTAVSTLISQLPNDERDYMISADAFFAYSSNGDISRINTAKGKKKVTLKADDLLMFIGKPDYKLRSSCYKLFSMNVINRNNLRFASDIQHGEDGLFVFEYVKCIHEFRYIPVPLWNILERPGSATTSPFSKAKLSAITAIERMMMHNNSRKIKDELEKFLVSRELSLTCEALLAEEIVDTDIKYLKRRLRASFWIYMVKEKKLKNILIYLFVTFLPKSIVKLYLKKR